MSVLYVLVVRTLNFKLFTSPVSTRPFLQKLFGIIGGVMSSVIFLVIAFLPTVFSERSEAMQLRLGVLAAVLIWVAILIGLILFIHKIGQVTRSRMVQIFTTVVSFVALELLLEVPLLVILLAVLVGFFLALLLGWADVDGQVMHIQKMIRRLVVGLMVFDAYALMTVLFALHSFFQQQVPFVLLVLIGAAMYGTIAWIIWRLYIPDVPRDRLGWSAGVLALVLFELIWVMKYLPLGYLVLGAMVTWIWYLLQLFFRFSFTSMGIIWKEQTVFLFVNAAMFAVVLLFLVRWI